MKETTRTVGAFDLAEDAVRLVQSAPRGLIVAYYVGSLPFVMGLLYFWADMSQSAFAYSRCATSALGVALLFVWMKTWQAIYGRGLLAFVQGETDLRWGKARVLRTLITQTAIQAWGALTFPFAFFALLPLPWLYAFYQNASVFGDGESETRDVVRRAWEQAKVWPRQNALLIWMLSPMLLVIAASLMLVLLPVVSTFAEGWAERSVYALVFILSLAMVPLSPLGVILAMNLAVVVILVPQLVESFLGIETVFARDAASALNTTVAAVVCAMAYLIMDPLVKAAYALRCFYGESIRTGADLKAALRAAEANADTAAAPDASTGSKTILRMALVVAAGFMVGSAYCDDTRVAAPTETATIAPSELDQAIEQVIHQREYSWRMLRQEEPEQEETGVLGNFLSDVRDMIVTAVIRVRGWLKAIIRWIADHWPGGEPEIRPNLPMATWMFSAQGLTYLLLAVAVLALLLLLFKLVRQRRRKEPSVVAEPVVTPEDLVEERLTADVMPEDRWLAMAQELMQRGDTRLALRALFLGTLALLARVELVTIRMFKSNRDYLRELERRAHAYPALPQAFGANVLLFESVWYGKHEVTQGTISEFSQNHNAIRRSVGDEVPLPAGNHVP